MSTYVPTDWTTEVPIMEDNLNHLEGGVESSHSEIEDIATGKTVVAAALETDKARFINAATQTSIGGIKVYNVIDSISGEVTSIITAPAVIDPPSAIIDFNASDNLPGMVRMSFSPNADAIYYDLYRDGELVISDISNGYLYLTSGGTWNFYLMSVNLFGETKSVGDSGTAKDIPTEPPAPIDDFFASDNQVLKVRFLWSDHGDASQYDLYSGTTLIKEDVLRGHEQIVSEGTADYYIIATNFLGTTESNHNTGTAHGLAPSAPQNFDASDDIVATIVTEFDYVPQPVTYDLYRDNILFRPGVPKDYSYATPEGTWEFFVRATGSITAAPPADSLPNHGSALPALYPPGEVLNFTASDDLRRLIRIDFESSLEAERYDLYRNEAFYLPDVYPGYEFDSDPGTWSFKVEAINTKGSTFSDPDDGTAVRAINAPPSIITDLAVSDTLVNAVQINYTRAEDALRHDLYRDGKVYQTDVSPADLFNTFSGTWDFTVIATNHLGSSTSDPSDEGTAVSSNSAPTKPLNFNATDTADGYENEIIMTFDASVGAARYDLYQTGLKVQEGIQSGYRFKTVAGTWDFYVMAVNLIAGVPSDQDQGSTIDATTVPDKPVIFATDDLPGEIVVTWADVPRALTYDVYVDSILAGTSVTSPWTMVSSTETVYLFTLVAINEVGSSPASDAVQGQAALVVGAPDYDGSLIANDGIGQVVITWNGVGNATSYDMYANDSKIATDVTSPYTHIIAPGTRAYNHRAKNDSETSTPSNGDMGTSLAEGEPPISVSNFLASTCYIYKVVFTWTNVPEADSYSLYDTNGVVQSNVDSGFELSVDAEHAMSYHVKSVNTEGSSDSNSSTGTTWAASGTLLFETPDSGTIVGGSTVPGDITLSLCLIGGGSSGSATATTITPYGYAGGGSAGEVVNTSHLIACSEELDYTVGIGGTAATAIVEQVMSGNSGTATTVGSFIAVGGSNSAYQGNGADGNICGNPVSDGLWTSIPVGASIYWVAFGGEKAGGIGGSGIVEAVSSGPLNGDAGSGGGAAVTYLTGNNATSGRGGDGLLKVTWGI